MNYEMVPVGDPGNVPDSTGYGAVPYEYQIGKYEVTIGQYVAFLNAVAKSDPNGLYTTNMTRQNIGGIARTGSAGAYVYGATGPFGVVQVPQATAANRPVVWVSWFDAARFANWMSNGQPIGPQGQTTTENGAYAISGTTIAPAMNTTNPNTGAAPLYHIPTENEWYKAAFYKGGGTNAGYWAYATQSDSPPGNLIGSNINQANYLRDGSGYSVTQSPTYVATQNYLTDVGAFPSSSSAYGAFDMSGNATELNDLDGSAGSVRGFRSGNWSSPGAYFLSSSGSARFTDRPSGGTLPALDGFRLASLIPIPEPSTSCMALAGLACGGFSMWRRRRRA